MGAPTPAQLPKPILAPPEESLPPSAATPTSRQDHTRRKSPMALVKELLLLTQTMQHEFVEQTRRYEQLVGNVRKWQAAQLQGLEEAEDVITAQDDLFRSFRASVDNARRDSANSALDLVFWRSQAEGKAGTAADPQDGQQGAGAKQRWRARQSKF